MDTHKMDDALLEQLAGRQIGRHEYNALGRSSVERATDFGGQCKSTAARSGCDCEERRH